MRSYIARYWVGGDHFEIRFTSRHYAGSRDNYYDARNAIRKRHGLYIANRAEIYEIALTVSTD